MVWRNIGIAIFLASLSNVIQAQETLQCRVVNVADGDTITCLENRVQYKIRLDGIDAPEKGQAFGRKAQQVLSNKIIQKTLHIQLHTKDRYGRLVGTLYYANNDINGWMIEQGYAWAYRKYLKHHNQHYLQLENNARSAGRGLWVDGSRAIYPEDYRKQQR